MRTKLLKTFATLAMLVCSLSASAEAITDVSQLREGMIYHISTRRGAWAVDEGTNTLQSTGTLDIDVNSSDTRQQFTFITINGARHLYHIAERKFIGRSRFDFAPVDPIYFSAGAYENTFVAYFDEEHYININIYLDVLIDDYTIADAGNSCTILPVGESAIRLIDGIYYIQIAEGELEVMHADNISGALDIPATITIEGKIYRVTSIGDGAFMSCPNLTSVNIPKGVTNIKDFAFYECKSLTSINIPEGVTNIGEGAFCWCVDLTSFTIPESVTSIGYNAFAQCSSLTSLSIPKSVTSIGYGAFGSCSNLTSISVDKNNAIYDSRDNCNAIIETASNTLIAGCSTSFIPEGVTSIGWSAFSGCSSLTAITIPESVTSIGYGAFMSCSNLTSINIPKSVTSIGRYAFSSCSSLTDVYCYSESVPTLDAEAFNRVDCSKITLHVPKSVIGDYMDSPSWNVFGKIVKLMVPGEQVTSLSHLSNDKVYTLRSARAFLLHSEAEGVADTICSNTGKLVGAVEYALGNPALHFRIEKQGGNYYLYSVGAGQYVGADGNYEAQANTVLKIEKVGGDYPWKLFLGDHGMNSQVQGRTNRGILVDWWTSTDEGNCYQIIEAATPSITLNQYLLTLAEGEAVELTATVNPDIVAGDPVTWSSSNPSIASVNATGVVTAVAAGTATITASLYDGRVAASCNVTVLLGRCEAPTINYAKGKVVLDCGTEDVQFVTETKSDNPHTAHSTDKEFDFVPSYTITTYATKNGYAASKVVTVTLCWIACGEQHEEGETDILNIPSKPVFIQSQGGVLTLTGLADDTEVVVYTANGVQVGAATAANGTASIATGMEAGAIAIVKIGEHSIKVAIK